MDSHGSKTVYLVTSSNFDEKEVIGIFADRDDAHLFAKQYSLRLLVEEIAQYYMEGDSSLWNNVETVFGFVNQITVSDFPLNSTKPLTDTSRSLSIDSNDSTSYIHGLDTESDLYVTLYEPYGYPIGYYDL